MAIQGTPKKMQREPQVTKGSPLPMSKQYPKK